MSQSIVPQRSIRLQQYHSNVLTSQTFTVGEIFYDADLKTLRIFDGVTKGGSGVLASQANINSAIATEVANRNSAISTAISTEVTNRNSAISTATAPLATTASVNSSIASAIAPLATTASLSSYVTSSSLTTTLGSYVTSSSLTTTLGSYVTSSSLTTTLGSYVTSSSLTTTLNGYATTASDALKAPIDSPTFTGTLTAPTAVIGGTNIKSLAIAMAAALS